MEHIPQNHMRDILFLLYAGGYYVGESTQHLRPAVLNIRRQISRSADHLFFNQDSIAAGILKSILFFAKFE